MKFEDLADIDDQEMRKVFRLSTVGNAALAFKDAPENVKRKLFGVIEPVYADFVRETMGLFKNPSEAEVEMARQEILHALQKIRAR
ncbi:MAG: hypothetical protein HY928_00725 [Elusimicrobia bacterium]|nr:hypothetical protein [Elusimicrobiota bacterium]